MLNALHARLDPVSETTDREAEEEEVESDWSESEEDEEEELETKKPKRCTGRVYKITNSENDKVYIGSTKRSLKRRLASHRYESRRDNSKWSQAMREIGKDRFDIHLLEEIPNTTLDELEIREFVWMAKYPIDMLYNTIIERGKVSEATKAKLSFSHQGITHSEETKAKMSLDRQGRILSEETRTKMSESKKTGGSIALDSRKSGFQYQYYQKQNDGSTKRIMEYFSFAPNSKNKWDREEAYFYAWKRKTELFPQHTGKTSEQIAERYSHGKGRFVDSIWISNETVEATA